MERRHPERPHRRRAGPAGTRARPGRRPAVCWGRPERFSTRNCAPAASANSGGSGEIRTHGRLATSPVFKTGAFNRSATLPLAVDVRRRFASAPHAAVLRECPHRWHANPHLGCIAFIRGDRPCSSSLSVPPPPPSWRRSASSPPPPPRMRRPTPPSRSGWSCPSRPAAPPTSSRAWWRSACPRAWASR